MTFLEATQKLGIEEYAEHIFNSNSHGELFHIGMYIKMAKHIKPDKVNEFKKWFKGIIELAEQQWERPESIYQHIDKFITADILKLFKDQKLWFVNQQN